MPNRGAVPGGPGLGASALRGVRPPDAFSSHWFRYLVGITETFILERQHLAR
jgi:hypothetical protein